MDNPMKRFLILLLAAVLLVPSAAFADDKNLKAAEKLFRTYMHYEDRFDPRLADLYADNALISTRMVDAATGDVETLHIPPTRYREMIREHINLARREKDKGRYAAIRYTEEGDNVRIRADRQSLRDNYTAPLTLLVGPNPDGEWVILEEFSEIRR